MFEEINVHHIDLNKNDVEQNDELIVVDMDQHLIGYLV
jgi:hypothetical protein